MKIFQEVITQCLGNVGTIKLEGHEHNAGEDHDTSVDFANYLVLFTPCPPEGWIKALEVFPVSY
jgi:hypothetical protein